MDNLQPEINIVQPKKKKWLKYILVFVGAIIILLLLIIFLPNILGFFIKDTAPIDDSDLRLSKVTISQDQNAYYDLIQIGDIYETKDTINYLSSNGWDNKIVEGILFNNLNQKALTFFDEAAQKTFFQDPAYADLSKNVNSDFHIIKIQQVSRLSALKALYLAHQGRVAEALDEADKSMAVGRKMSISQAPLLGYIMGSAIESIGLNTLNNILEISFISTPVLLQYSQRLDQFKDSEQGFINGLKYQYMAASSYIDAISKGEAKLSSLIPTIGEDDKDLVMNNAKGSFYLQPNKTKLRLAERYRLVINDINKPCGLMKNDTTASSLSTSTSLIEKYFMSNLIGEAIYSFVEPSSSDGKVICDNDLSVSATQLLFAIKAYKINNKTLPSSLSELVPKYILSVPLDPFDGKLIRYSSSKKIIYSVGPNTVDLGGSEDEDARAARIAPNPTFKINF